MIYATDVFSDMSENVVVGEATASVVDGPATGRRSTTSRWCRSDDPRMPAGRPINGFGFEVNPAQIKAGTLVSVEGYYRRRQAELPLASRPTVPRLVSPTTAEVSILRAQCRIRGGGRDELEVRGGTRTRPTP